MPILLHNIDIETITSIRRINNPLTNSLPLGLQSIRNTQHLQNSLRQYLIRGSWTQGDADYDSKEAKVQNLVSGGLPVWLDASTWRKNAHLFGRVSDFECDNDEGAVDVTEFQFRITSVFPWGYLFVQSDGTGRFAVYDLDKFVQSRVLDPSDRRCNWSKTGTFESGTISFQFHVKNIGGSSGTVVIEFMMPDGISHTAVTITSNVGGTITKNSGDVGTTGFSSNPGTKRRVTASKSIGAGSEELWTVSIPYSSSKTSYLDGSINENAA